MTRHQHLARRFTTLAALAVIACSGATCAPEDSGEMETLDNKIARLLADGHPVFGIFSGDHTVEQGALMASNRQTDFVFYSLETGPFDLQTMGSYSQAMAQSAGESGTHPLALRIPPINLGADTARARVTRAIAAGVDAVVFPHVQTAEDAQIAVASMGDRLWPQNPSGDLVNMLIVEDQAGIANVRDIVMTPGVSIVFAGPGDLRRAYEGDMEAVEGAIQAVLSACLEFSVPCGITAGVDDIATRLDQGFRVIIVTEEAALAAGRTASGRAGATS